MSKRAKAPATVEITMQEWEDYVRLQAAAKVNGWTLFDILRKVGSMEVRAGGNGGSRRHFCR
jgi:hypothetical protein